MEDTPWNPYAVGPVDTRGGVITEERLLPRVDPPGNRLKEPYLMEPIWQEGSTETDNLYRKACRVRHTGKLYYVGPTKEVRDDGMEVYEYGSYLWVVQGFGPGGKGFLKAPQPDRKGASLTDEPYDDPKWYFKHGVEVPPWFRRGPLAQPALVKFYCGVHQRPSPVAPQPTLTANPIPSVSPMPIKKKDDKKDGKKDKKDDKKDKKGGKKDRDRDDRKDNRKDKDDRKDNRKDRDDKKDRKDKRKDRDDKRDDKRKERDDRRRDRDDDSD